MGTGFDFGEGSADLRRLLSARIGPAGIELGNGQVLGERHLAVLKALNGGLTNRAIADEVGYSESAIKQCLAEIAEMTELRRVQMGVLYEHLRLSLR